MFTYRYPRRTYALASLAMIVACLVFMFALKDRILDSYNGVTPLLWIFITFISGPISGISAALTITHLRADENAISNTTPRSWIALKLCDLLVRYTTLALMPFCLAYLLALAASSITTHRGLLDLGYIPSALLFTAIPVIVGEIIATIISIQLIAVLASLILGTFLGIYATNAVSTINNCDTWNPAIYRLIIPCLTIGILTLLIGYIYHFTSHPKTTFSLQLALSAALFIVFFLHSGTPLSTMRHPTASNFFCNTHGKDTICVWKESDYKVPAFTKQIERGNLLLTLAGNPPKPALFLETGLEPVKDNLQNKSTIEDTFTLGALGGNENPWVSAQMIAGPYLDKLLADVHSCNDTDDARWALMDITTNYVYGDITFSGYSSENVTNDNAVARLGQKWAGYTNEQIVQELMRMVDEYRTTCQVKDLS
ncbi:hypothetical protein [Trueperella sp. LYQ143]|uniref:hypothetical protein n=1 Tax=unclassified Trueperella TaxID=2630174 RepID=UPI003982ED8D